ncbi:hypothetical protein [Formosa sp. PL04]|uniref:hypothetical protein n=1 Tax=Formosa sp. PL04 TaxID=3081755 RepID=UPI0029819955|nr:hypothetical protein [Formosa sp. PL04]MDW5289981.1 hypothetical protein [Formosa sp. PL04]
MKSILLVIIGLCCSLLSAQKRVDKSIDAQDITTLQINGKNCFKIHVISTHTNQIVIQTRIDGEHSEEMIVITRKSNDSLYVSTQFQPLFEADNDKLSAHKLMSIELEIQIPKHFNLNIKSDISSVVTQGVFNTAFIELNQGNCRLESFVGSATINTIQGSIYVETNFANVKASSRHGVVTIQRLISGENQLDLKSIHGDISVFKIE